MVKRYFNPRAINYFYSSDLIDSLMKRLPRFTTTSFLKHVRRKDLLEETSTHYIELVKFIENRDQNQVKLKATRVAIGLYGTV